ncbi:hypothetical protein ACIP4U_40210 [Streptomyces caelestis]|uniref:hypothetical protein n=1 Tax=Streptomyces caelestis TaxID=36816 RepID=UPI0038273C9D
MSTYGHQANRNAELAAARWREDKQTGAISEGLAAVVYALLEVARAIRDHTESQESQTGQIREDVSETEASTVLSDGQEARMTFNWEVPPWLRPDDSTHVVNGERFTLTTVDGVPTAFGRTE